MFDRLLELLDSKWLIHRDTAASYLPLLISYLNGQPVAFSFNKNKGRFAKSNLLVKKGSGFKCMYDEQDENLNIDYGDPEIPEFSVALITIQGPVFSWRSLQLIEEIKAADANPHIIAAIFVVNSPGGQVFMTDLTANAIKNFQKPSIGLVLNMAASAAMWMLSATDYRIATSPMDQIGSIGAYTSFTNMRGFFKDKLNIDIIDIYATLSTRKNELSRALMEGNNEPVIKDLDFVNDIFHTAIRENLGIEQSSEVFTGAIYNAPLAIEQGLIHEINTIEYAFQKAYDDGLIYSMNQFYKSNQNPRQ